ncbi:MAG: hypothetical protein OEY16_09625 [Alphaproteobacteria bacterium]|jgi:hypothetical protein|nr:hypothetical protein [Alphaproteobacteria bacterium]
MVKIIMMTGAAAYTLGFGVYFIVFISSNWGDADWVMHKSAEGFGLALAWPYLLFQYFVEGTPLM